MAALCRDAATLPRLKILILKPSSLGDVVQALPVLRLLKQYYRESEIFWWIDAGLAPLLDDALRSMLTVETFADRRFLTTTLMSVAAIVFVTELGFFQKVFDTVALTGRQWAICIGAGLVIAVVSELRKLLLRRRGEQAVEPAAAPAA